MGKSESSKSSISKMFGNAFRKSSAASPASTEATQHQQPAKGPPPAAASSSQAAPPPPSYTEATRQSVQNDNDPHAFLSSFDTVFLVDDSGSMHGRRWEETRAVLTAIVPVCTAHDADGVDIYFLNHKTREDIDKSKGSAGTGYRGVKDPKKVQAIFDSVKPSGATPTATRLRAILKPYLTFYEEQLKKTGDETCLKPLNIIVITDGAPTDEPDTTIIQFAKVLDRLEAPPYQVGIQFFQVGNDPTAAKALKELDDELASGTNADLRDMVDTTTFDDRAAVGSPSQGSTDTELTADTVLKIVLGAVVRKLDRVQTRRP
ncbi:Ca-activated chloride channel-like protein [Microdochium nivale]|nr:Ca-activated chloride channel-like protein [Microdochium nivale]